MIIKIIVYIFISLVVIFGSHLFHLTFLTPSRTGNYLKIRKPVKRVRSYGILPRYRFVLKRLAAYFAVVSPFYIILPLYFSAGISVMILLGGEWWRKGKGEYKRSVFYEWVDGGYTVRSLLLVISVGIGVLISLHFAIYPVVFRIITGYER